jgi:hypothetical protein
LGEKCLIEEKQLFAQNGAVGLGCFFGLELGLVAG